MRIALPTTSDHGLDAIVAGHFGRAPFFTFVDVDTGAATVRANPDPGAAGCGPDLLVDSDVQLVLCQHLGQGARRRLDAAGTKVLAGARGSVRDALAAHRSGQLHEVTDTDTCHQHRHPGHDGCGRGRHRT